MVTRRAITFSFHAANPKSPSHIRLDSKNGRHAMSVRAIVALVAVVLFAAASTAAMARHAKVRHHGPGIAAVSGPAASARFVRAGEQAWFARASRTSDSR